MRNYLRGNFSLELSYLMGNTRWLSWLSVQTQILSQVMIPEL